MLRRCVVIRVVYQPMDDVKPPERTPELPKQSRFLRGRMKQMRHSLGMTEAEVDALVDRANGTGEVEPRKSENVPAKLHEPTWAEIVEKREREGKLFSAKRITEAFPYINNNARGVPDFKDSFREEQMMAMVDSPTNHPSSIMMRMQEERMRGAFLMVVVMYFSYCTTLAYLEEQDATADPAYNRSDFYLNKDQSIERVQRGDEELLPILKSNHEGYVVVWTPQSKVSRMMWHNRQGHANANHTYTAPGLLNPKIMMDDQNYTYPGYLSKLVDSHQSQIKFQHDRMVARDINARMHGVGDD
eukprot:TRINITY_DN23384_c0_g1_i1.p1 TRINITY_DN23384_c0_g1~~TRINITY_DN23384_c0_g1_i1.p1  ORF type:complete len:317 (+),score=104.22 TRINITY_DN23384_c0_g1_i1:49-951(+)